MTFAERSMHAILTPSPSRQTAHMPPVLKVVNSVQSATTVSSSIASRASPCSVRRSKSRMLQTSLPQARAYLDKLFLSPVMNLPELSRSMQPQIFFKFAVCRRLLMLRAMTRANGTRMALSAGLSIVSHVGCCSFQMCQSETEKKLFSPTRFLTADS